VSVDGLRETTSVVDLVTDSFPGVVLESNIQGWAFLGEFERGYAAYQNLASPTGEDDRWAGVCLFQLFRDLEALEHLYKAVNRGVDGARINIAHVLRFVERGEEATSELSKVKVDRLSPYDEVLYHRVLSLQQENDGSLREALRAAEEAWRRVQGIPEYSLLAPSILAQLAVLHGRIGRSQRALWFLERGLQITEGTERLKIRLRRAVVLVNLGRYHEAQIELESLDLNEAPEAYQVERRMLFGEVAWATGNLALAQAHYQRAIDLATRQQFGFEELTCRLALVCILGVRSDFPAASTHLARAQVLISDRSDRLLFRFREVLLNAWLGSYTLPHTHEEFQALITDFGDMGLLQEQAAVRLHRADILRRMGRPFEQELDQLAALSVTLQNPAFLAREWTLLPELQQIAMKTHPRIAGEPPVVLEVFTLGDERMILDGKPVNIPLRRGVEVMAYFLEHKAVSLRKIMADVFPDEKPRSAKSYFHQFRHQLRENLEGVEIEYDSEARLYRLKSEIDVLWDVSELRAGRVMGETGIFLPSSGNEWAQQVDQHLDEYRAAAKKS